MGEFMGAFLSLTDILLMIITIIVSAILTIIYS
jgi:hypothetical protein